MFDNELEWMLFREEAYLFNKQREEGVLKQWLCDIGYEYHEPIGYYRDISERIMTLYCRRPGVLIGKAGVNVNKLQTLLSNEFHGKWKVKFVEIRGGFIQI